MLYFIVLDTYTPHGLLSFDIYIMFLIAVSRPRLSETEPKWFMFGSSCYAFGGQIRRLAKFNVNRVNICLLYRINSTCMLFLSIYTFIIY